MGSRTQGIVAEYAPNRGFGFIKPDSDMRRHVVVRAKALKEAGLSVLREGDRVEFTLVYSKRYIPLAKELIRLSSQDHRIRQ